MSLNALITSFTELAVLLELDGANVFKTSAYDKAARALADFDGDFEALVKQQRTTEIPGIGPGIAAKIDEFYRTGAIAELEDLRARIPRGIVEMMRIPGLGAKKARALYEACQIATIDDLKAACERGDVAKLKGFGAKTAEKILAGIAQISQYAGRYRFDVALEASHRMLTELRKCPAIERVEVAGSVRRGKEIIKDIDFVAATTDPVAVMDYFTSLPAVASITGKGETKSSVVLLNGMQADLRCVQPSAFAYALMHFTGSQAHNVRMRQRAKEFGLKLNEYGLFPDDGESSTPLPAQSEEEIHAHLKLAYMPPELREDMGELEAAERHAVPQLVAGRDLRGLLHMHTHYSDGKPTLEEYAQWALEHKLEWMGIADHSQSLRVANGLNEERVLAQHREIDALNAKYSSRGIRLLKGIESDILVDGRLDYSDEFLNHFEWIVASVHSHFNLTEAEQTARILRAVEHPRTTVLGHLTGRLLLQREGYAVDQKEIIRAAGKAGVAIEINANPRRLDIDWRLVHYALEHGVKICISPDAHVIEGLMDYAFGVIMARKGWATKEHVLNCLSAEEFLKFAKRS